MLVYNVTVKVHPSIEREWVDWQKKEIIPEIMKTGRFTDHKFYRLLEQDETDGITYVMQYFAAKPEDYQEYLQKYAPSLRKKAIEKWGDKFIAFDTTMEVVN